MDRKEIDEMPAHLPDVLSPKIAAVAVGTTPQTIRSKCIEGKIKAVHVGKLWKIPKPMFAKYLEGEGSGKK